MVPRPLAVACRLLWVNLALSVLVTVLSFIEMGHLLDVLVAREHGLLTGAQLQAARDGQRAAVVGRAVGNVVVAFVYAALIRGLRAGKRRSHRRALRLSGIGFLGLGFSVLRPNLAVFRIEECLQLMVLAAMFLLLNQQEVRQFVAAGGAGGHAPQSAPATVPPGTILPGTILPGTVLPGTVLPGQRPDPWAVTPDRAPFPAVAVAPQRSAPAAPIQGWAPDPSGRHEARYFSAGTPTTLVRDGAQESFDDLPDRGPS